MFGLITDCSYLDVWMAEGMFVLCICAAVRMLLSICVFTYKSSLIKQSAAAHLHLANVKRKINERFVAGSLYILCGLFSHSERERFVLFLLDKS